MIKVHDKDFKLYISEAQLRGKINELGQKIAADFEGQRPVFIGILNGAFIFMSDLVRATTIDCELTFIKVQSYDGLTSSGKVLDVIGLNIDIKDKPIIIVEDIVDTGRTMNYLIEELQTYAPSEIKVATLLYKPNALQYDVPLDYVGFEIPNKFVVGYGLDYDEAGRHYRDIYQLAIYK